MSIRSLPARAVLLVLALLCALPAAAERLRDLDDVVSVSLRPGWREADGTHWAGLRIALAPGWKTYWRAPGPLGIPPRFDWRGSRNLRAVAPVWPRPAVVAQQGGHAIGYAGDVTVPLRVVPGDEGAPVRLRGRIDLGVCAEVCVPVRLSLDAVLPARGAADPAIRAALSDRPARGAGQAVCALASDGAHPVLRIVLPVGTLGGAEAVAVEAGAGTWTGPVAVERRGRALHAAARIEGALERDALRLTAVGRDRAVTFEGCTAP